MNASVQLVSFLINSAMYCFIMWLCFYTVYIFKCYVCCYILVCLMLAQNSHVASGFVITEGGEGVKTGCGIGLFYFLGNGIGPIYFLGNGIDPVVGNGIGLFYFLGNGIGQIYFTGNGKDPAYFVGKCHFPHIKYSHWQPHCNNHPFYLIGANKCKVSYVFIQKMSRITKLWRLIIR